LTQLLNPNQTLQLRRYGFSTDRHQEEITSF
jgi:hypothetical protein